MADNDNSYESFIGELHKRVGHLDEPQMVELINLLQQDRRGQVRPFTDKQISTILANCGSMQSMKSMDIQVMAAVLEKLQDPKYISVMHQIGRKELQQFINQLTKTQTTELVSYLAPFFTQYTEHFVTCLSSDQKAEVFSDILPCVLNTAKKEGSTATMLAALYDPPDLATAIEFLGHNKIIAKNKKDRERRKGSSKSRTARHKTKTNSTPPVLDTAIDEPLADQEVTTKTSPVPVAQTPVSSDTSDSESEIQPQNTFSAQ